MDKGEDKGMTKDWLEECIRKCKKTYWEGVRGKVTYTIDSEIVKPLAQAIRKEIAGRLPEEQTKEREIYGFDFPVTEGYNQALKQVKERLTKLSDSDSKERISA